MLSAFEHDPDGEWNRFGLMPLREALHSNRWKQPGLEQASGDFLAKKYLTGDPVRMYVALRIWNEYLKAREPRDRESACERFIGKMNGFILGWVVQLQIGFVHPPPNPDGATFFR